MTEIELKRHPETGELIQEEWRDIDDYDGWYEVSNYGRVRSWKKCGAGDFKRDTPKILSATNDNQGYLHVKLYNETIKCRKVHQLVGEAFINNPEDKPQINHLDGDKKNNFYLNLRWSTQSENQIHAFDMGLNTPTVGEDHKMSKLTEKDVLDIRSMYDDGDYSYRDLGRKFNISHGLVGQIINRNTWKHI